MLGHGMADPEQLEDGDLEGFGLLDVATTLAPEKTTRQREVRWVDGGFVHGYEIHHGRTQAGPRAIPHLEDDLGWQQENIRGVYLHGLMENTAYRQHFLSGLGWQGEAGDWQAQLDAALDRVARLVTDSGWLAGKLAAVGLFFAATFALQAGDRTNAVANEAPTNPAIVSNASTNALWLWRDELIDVTRTNLLAYSDRSATNLWLPPGRDGLLATASTWRTTATLGVGFFQADRVGAPIGFGDGCRNVDGWFQEVGVERAMDHGNSGVLIGVGVGMGRATTRFP